MTFCRNIIKKTVKTSFLIFQTHCVIELWDKTLHPTLYNLTIFRKIYKNEYFVGEILCDFLAEVLSRKSSVAFWTLDVTLQFQISHTCFPSHVFASFVFLMFSVFTFQEK